MNKGVLLSKGNWLYFLGADDKLNNKNTLSHIFRNLNITNEKLIIGNIKNNFKNTDSFLMKKNKGVIYSEWSPFLWIKNTLPHQGVFYKTELFANQNFDTRYTVLADYAFNLNLFKQKYSILRIDKIIAVCGTSGISKKYNWNLYKEEAELKTKASSPFLKPVFFLFGLVKYTFKKLDSL